MLKHVIGEWSAVLRQYLRRQLLGPGGLMSGGLALEVHGEPKMLYGRLTNSLRVIPMGAIKPTKKNTRATHTHTPMYKVREQIR